MNIATQHYFYRGEKPGSTLLLPGVNQGIDSDFIKSVIDKAVQDGQSVLAVNFPHHDKPELERPSDGLVAESALVADSITQLAHEGLIPVHAIVKSLGAAVLSYSLQQNPGLKEQINKITILGMPIGDVKTVAFKDIPVDVIQGSEDRYGDAQAVREEFDKADVELNRVIEIVGGDHSYRDAARNPALQGTAIRSIVF